MARRGRQGQQRDTLPLRDHDDAEPRERYRDGRDDGRRTGGRSVLGGTARVAVIAAAAAVIVVAVVGVVWFSGLRDSLRNPFAGRDVDRSQPVVLNAIDNLAVFQAATGNFQVVVDLEKDAPFLPPAIRGERILFVASGRVDATVDFSNLRGENIRVSEDGNAVEIILNRPTLDRPEIDPARSYVVDRQRGILDRLGGVFADNPTSERELYLLSEGKLAEAARDTELVKRAEDNTRSTLTGMMESLGFSKVTVTFVDPPPPPAGGGGGG